MELSKRIEGDILIIEVLGERVDAASAIALKQAFIEQVEGHTGRILMDLEKVTFMDSSGLGAMVASLKSLDGKVLELVNLRGAVARVFGLTRMDRVFRIHETMDAAIADEDSGQAA